MRTWPSNLAVNGYEDDTTKRLVKQPLNLKLAVLNGKGGMPAGIRADSNRSMLGAADGFDDTTHLLAHAANAKHLLKSISQYRAGRRAHQAVLIAMREQTKACV